MSFDSLTYARRLKAAGFSDAQAEALADANRELLMSDLATKDDIALLRGDAVSIRTGMTGMDQKLHGDMMSMEQKLHGDMTGMEQKLRGDMLSMEQKLRGDMASMEQRLDARIEALGLRLTIRLGVMMGAAVAILGAILRLH